MKRATGRYNIVVDLCTISIHALVKRATALAVNDSITKDISIHALVKRATDRYFV